MKVRLRIWLALSLVFTIVFPWLRQTTIGFYLPDVWLLTLLVAVPTPFPHSARNPIIMACCLALLRSSVSLCSPIASCAALVSGLLLRQQLTRRLSDSLFIYRFFTASIAALPMMIIDLKVADNSDIAVNYSVWLWRVALTGLVVAVVKRRSGGLLFGGKR
ncbi:MAG: hypothetical protein ACI84O_000686 [Myxococcota bacterium]|jgi:hypothetical protein